MTLANRKRVLREALHIDQVGLKFCMEEFVDIQCPFCGQTFAVAVDTSIDTQRFITDCEICCRPFEIAAECESGGVKAVEVLLG
jgi:transcription elongation factor Elf1